MRILSILAFSPPSPTYGGAERQMHALHKGLRARGIDVHVLADIRQVSLGYQICEGVPVWGVPFPTLTAHPLRPGNLKFWRDWRTVRRIVMEQIPRPDLIQVTTFRQPALIGYWLARELNIPWVVRLACSGSHGDLTFAMGNWLSRSLWPRMADSVAQVVALDEQTRAEVIAHGVPIERVRIIQNGLVFQRPPSGAGKRFNAEPLTILYLGRLAKQKRVDTLLTAFANIRANAVSVNALRVIGGGEESEVLATYARQLGLAELCSFPGAVLFPEDELESADCFINPSESEGLPNAVLEAAAFGLPLILSDIPIHREIAGAVGMSAYLFPVGNADELSASLRRFIKLDITEKKRLSCQCAEFGQRFTTHNRDEAYLELYHQILAGRTLQC